jgi:hypothetical protein
VAGYNSTLGARLRKLELASGGSNQKIYPGRIIARDDADKDRQIAELLAAGRISPDTLVICRMIVSPGQLHVGDCKQATA